MTVVHLVRHAERLGVGPGDPPISDAGRAQAVSAARALAGQPVAAVYTSPLRRALETAEIIAPVHSVEPRGHSLLRERANWGDVPGQSWQDFAEIWARCCAQRTLDPAIGDSSVEAGRRLEEFLAIVARESGEAVVAVTHGGILADFLLNVCSPRAWNLGDFDQRRIVNDRILELYGGIHSTRSSGKPRSIEGHMEPAAACFQPDRM
jgi:broad specificity phosphatase PhoE